MKLLKVLCLTALTCILASCASLPSTVNPGDSLVIARVTTQTTNYQDFYDIKVDGKQTNRLEVTIQDTLSGKTKTYYTKTDGMLYLKNLNTDSKYKITKVLINLEGNYNAYFKIWVDLSKSDLSFRPKADYVTNLGDINFTFDKNSGYVTWTLGNHYYAEKLFKEIAEDTPWENLPIEIVRGFKAE